MDWTENVDAAGWIVDRLHPFGQDVGSLLPDTFAAYARIVHPDRTGTLDEPQLLALLDVLKDQGSPAPCWFAVWDGYGWLSGPPAVAGLGPARAGHDQVPALTLPSARIAAPRRSYALYQGVVTDALALSRAGVPQSPNLWWPDDRSWCVASEVDLESTYVGGSLDLIRRLHTAGRLDPLVARPGDAIGC